MATSISPPYTDDYGCLSQLSCNTHSGSRGWSCELFREAVRPAPAERGIASLASANRVLGQPGLVRSIGCDSNHYDEPQEYCTFGEYGRGRTRGFAFSGRGIDLGRVW